MIPGNSDVLPWAGLYLDQVCGLNNKPQRLQQH